jgi:proteasome lid subunit RPN8/RPN11
VAADRYPPEVLRQLVALCEADPGREVCGLVVRLRGALEVRPIDNAADRYHAADPARFPRTGRDSYLMDPLPLRRVFCEVEAAGGDVVAVWHSHVEAGAYLSAKDRHDAIADGVQLVPGAEYLVLAVRAGRVTEARRFRWSSGEFVEEPLAGPRHPPT